ncbi:MAG: HlyD family efflux transporter periplasmic adaptor subunit, partial [Fimbriiglobus sp.]
MPRVRRWVAVAAGSVSLGAAACNNFNAPQAPDTAARATETPKPAVVVDIGKPLFPKAAMPPTEAPTPQAEPVVIHPAYVQYDLKVHIPAQVDGLIELIATPLKPGEIADPADPLIVYHPRDNEKKQPFRRLRENDRVEKGQTLVRIDEQLVARQMDIAERMIPLIEQNIVTDKKALESYRVLLTMSIELFKKGNGALMAVKENETTVYRLEGSVVEKEKEKAKALGELLSAQTQLTRYWCRCPVNGRVMKLLKSPGEFAKAGDAILEIQSTDRVRVEGKLPIEYSTSIKPGTPAVIEPTVPLGPLPYANWHRQEVNSVAVTTHPGRPLIVSGGSDATALVWDVTGSKHSYRLPHPSGVAVRAVAAGATAAKKQWVATGGDDGKVRLWDVTNPDKLPTEPTAVLDDGHGAAITAAAFSRDGRFLSTAAGREVFVWDLEARKKKYALPQEHRDVVTCVTFTPQARLVTESRDRTIRVWNLGEAAAAVTEPVIDHRTGNVDGLGVSSDGSKVLFDKDPGRLDVLSLVDGRTLGTVQNPSGSARFTGLAIFSPDDKWILTAGGDADVKGELQFWEAPATGGRASERRRP